MGQIIVNILGGWVICFLLFILEAINAPEGEEIPYVGFVRKPEA